MEQQLNSSTGGWIGDDRRDEADFTSVSQTIAKPIVVRRLFLLLVKWILLNPLVNLSYVINGRMIGQPKWYERKFSMPIRNKRLNRITYQLTKYVMFG